MNSFPFHLLIFGILCEQCLTILFKSQRNEPQTCSLCANWPNERVQTRSNTEWQQTANFRKELGDYIEIGKSWNHEDSFNTPFTEMHQYIDSRSTLLKAHRTVMLSLDWFPCWCFGNARWLEFWSGQLSVQLHRQMKEELEVKMCLPYAATYRIPFLPHTAD